MLIKVVATGRQWGDKKDPVESVQKVNGIPVLYQEWDGWEGPLEAGDKGQYFRFHAIDAHSMRDDRGAA